MFPGTDTVIRFFLKTGDAGTGLITEGYCTMKKIITLFARNYETDHLVRNEVVPGAEWVIAGEGIATKKYDGTCCMVRDGKLYKRYEIKPGGKAPPNFEAANEIDPETEKQQGWVPVGDGSDDKYHREAFKPDMPDGTYELCGPKIQGNPEHFLYHVLIPHGQDLSVGEPPRDFEGLKAWFRDKDIEGVVWHHPGDGRMVKIKKRDFDRKNKRS